MTLTAPMITPQREPAPALVTLANAARPRRPAGVRAAYAADPFASHAAAVELLAPLGLSRPLGEDELDDLRRLADETRKITDALVGDGPLPGLEIVNRLAGQANATRSLRVTPDGSLATEVQWHVASAAAELASRIVAELGRIDPTRLRFCARDVCDLLFYDVTRSKTQRWHSDSPCGARERQERWKHGPRSS
jgi:hypothetical protein